MKAIKIQATQTTANYRKTEQAKLRNSFLLPPISTFWGGGYSQRGWMGRIPSNPHWYKGEIWVYFEENIHKPMGLQQCTIEKAPKERMSI